MKSENVELDQMQLSYKSAVEEWIAAIRHEEALASKNHSVAEIDQWEHAHFKEEEVSHKSEGREKTIRGGATREALRVLVRSSGPNRSQA